MSANDQKPVTLLFTQAAESQKSVQPDPTPSEDDEFGFYPEFGDVFAHSL